MSHDQSLLTVKAHQTALRAQYGTMLDTLATDGTEVAVSRRGGPPRFGPLRKEGPFFTAGRHVFTAEKIADLYQVNGYINIILL